MQGLSPGWNYLLKRVALAIVSLLAVSIIIFWATQVLPGDAATAVLGRNASPERLEALRKEMALDRPLYQQYFTWLGNFVTLNLGNSMVNKQAVVDIVGRRIANSMTLLAVVSLISLPLAILAGAVAADREGRAFDNAVSTTALALAAVPEFVVGIACTILFATVVFRWFPPVAMLEPGASLLDHWDVLVLPALTLTIVTFPYVFRMVRSSVIDVLSSEYIEMARLKGVSKRRILYRHALPNALAPGIQAVALTLGYLAGGVVMVEVVFAFPGVGEGLVNAITTRDLPVVQALVLFLAAFYIVVNLVADILSILLTPKLRTQLWPQT
ncbi:MAG: ABC transporter permease [Amaricoccus sp.]